MANSEQMTAPVTAIRRRMLSISGRHCCPKKQQGTYSLGYHHPVWHGAVDMFTSRTKTNPGSHRRQ